MQPRVLCDMLRLGFEVGMAAGVPPAEKVRLLLAV
jgi:hypothetical protein